MIFSENKMSAYVFGKDLMAALKIVGFEFVREYVLKGLTPHTDQGNPYLPAEVVYDFTRRLEQELAHHDEFAWSLTGLEREEYIAAHIQPLQERIEKYRNYFDCIQDFTWSGFGLPHDYELALSFIETLENSHYLKEEVTRFLPWPVKPAVKTKQSVIESKPPQLNHSQECKLKCRQEARLIWEEDPLLTIAEMIKRPEIIRNSIKLNGTPYSEKTVRYWIECLCPNRRPGRKPLKKRKQVNGAF